MLKFIQGDITKPQKRDDETIFIPHVVNNLGIMGSGAALGLKNKWPKVYQVYKEMEEDSPNGLKNRLGEISYVEVEPKITVVNMIAQNGLIGKDNKKPIKYWALLSCMNEVKSLIARSFISINKMSIHTVKFGSLRAGGNWDFILELINETWVENGIDVVVYEYK